MAKKDKGAGVELDNDGQAAQAAGVELDDGQAAQAAGAALDDDGLGLAVEAMRAQIAAHNEIMALAQEFPAYFRDACHAYAACQAACGILARGPLAPASSHPKAIAAQAWAIADAMIAEFDARQPKDDDEAATAQAAAQALGQAQA